MIDVVERALHLWGQPVPSGAAGLDVFREVYADPLAVNGAPTDVAVLVERARMMQVALAGLRHEIHELVVTPGRRAFAFTISGRFAGPLTTPLGVVMAPGRDVTVAGMDIFLVDEAADLVTDVWAIADYLGLLVQAGAVALVS